MFENKLNVIELSGPFSPEEDPSRYEAWVLWVLLLCEPSDNRLGGGGSQRGAGGLEGGTETLQSHGLLGEGHPSIKLFVNAHKLCKPFWVSGKK